MNRYLITGSKGLLGSAFERAFVKNKFKYLALNHEDCDLLDYSSLYRFVESFKPNILINCAALVGGIKANDERSFDFYYTNSIIQTNIMKLCKDLNVKNLVLLNSNCSYPINSQQPYKESNFLDGQPHNSNLGYATAKRSGYLGGLMLQKQYGIKTYHPIPCSLYGPNDNFNLENSHFIAAAIRKIFEAKKAKSSKLEFWGSGKPRREFMYVDDAVEGILFLLEKKLSGELVNISWGIDHSIKDVIKIISEELKFEGEIIWDKSKKDGAMSKLQDCTYLSKLGWRPKISLEEGLLKTINWFKNSKNIRK